MNRREDFNHYREKYPTFIYKSYSYEIEDDLKIIYHFEIPGLKEFHPEIIIPKKHITEFLFQIYFRITKRFYILTVTLQFWEMLPNFTIIIFTAFMLVLQ